MGRERSIRDVPSAGFASRLTSAAAAPYDELPVMMVNVLLLPTFARLSLFLVGLFGLLLGAIRLEALNDRVIVNLGDCPAACWQGVEPGKTLSGDALRHLSALYGFPPNLSPCTDLLTNYCERYTWRSETPPGTTTQLTIVHDRIRSVVVSPPGFTLGEVILSLGTHYAGFSGASSALANRHFSFQLGFDETRLGLSLALPCPATYLALMQTPIANFSIGLPIPNPQRYYDLYSFAAVRRVFFHGCEGVFSS